MREVWDYKNANVNPIQIAFSSIDWEFLFRGTNVNKKVDILNECLKNIVHDFIPNKIIKCNVNKKVDILNECLKNIVHDFIPNRIIKSNYRDPPWMTDVIKIKLKERSYLTKTYNKYGKRKSDFEKLIVKTKEYVETISAAKDKYII